jgi:hypothetical protein
MNVVLAVLMIVVLAWLAVLTFGLVGQNREIQILLVSLRHLVGAEKHVGGTGRNRRRTDFRVPVKLSGFLRVLDHARPCRVVDLSRSGAQVLPDGGEFPVGETGVLTVDFGEFESATTHAKVVRAIDLTGTYGVQFVDAPAAFRDKCIQTIRLRFREQLGK